ncbi:hypothetical protein [Kineococcus terrestris]|uniref:hypothetical protein n=1 Tax=Kineococcus terrestris TaxID=2044856 RepID=UPI0034DAC968
MPAALLQPAAPHTAASSAAWLRTRLVPGPHAPTGFAAAARLLHPARDEHEQPATWAQVATRTGQPLHPDTTWEQVSATVRTRRSSHSRWPGSDPHLGELGQAGWDALLRHLRRYSGTRAHCLLAVDENLPWVSGHGIGFYGDPHHIEPPQEPAFDAHVRARAPRLLTGSRSYLLLTGTLDAVPTLGRTLRYREERWFERYSPSLLWPLDRSWLVCTDLDFDYTFATGPRSLLEAVLADDRLEAQVLLQR